MFKIVMTYPDGTTEEDEELFDTEEEANEYGLIQLGNYAEGGEVLHLSNPGDYPLEQGEPDFEVVEVQG